MSPGPRFAKAPTVQPGPGEHTPQVAIVTLTASEPVETRIHVQQGSLSWTLVYPEVLNPSEGLPVLGLLPGVQATFTVQIVSRDGTAGTNADLLQYTPAPLPSGSREFPPFDLAVSRPERMAPGYTLLAVRRRALGRPRDLTDRQRDFMLGWSMLIVVDHAGRIRWRHRLLRRVAGIQHLQSGNIFYHNTDSRSTEIDMLGLIRAEWYARDRPAGLAEGAVPIPVQTLHHQPHQMPNGNFLALAGNARLVKDWYTSEFDPDAPRADKRIVGDRIIEFTPDGEVVWSWDSFDHLDTNRIGYNALESYWHVRGFPDHGDWTHGNGVAYDPSDDSVVVSFRLQDALFKIDRKSGDIKWILGDHSGWSDAYRSKLLTPVGEGFRWPWHGHNPRVTSEGTIVFFDNGILGARPFARPKAPHETFSRGVEYAVDESSMTVREIWTSARENSRIKERTWAMGDAHRLEETNTMLVVHSICMPDRDDMSFDEKDASQRHPDDFATRARVLEFTRDEEPEVLFDLQVEDPDELMQWEIYGAARMASLYPTGSGVEEYPGNALI